MQGYFDALAQSVKSIADDPTIDEKQKLEMLLESMEQFREAVQAEEPEPVEEPAPAQEPAEEPVREPEYEDILEEEEDRYDDLEDDRYEDIVEVHKFNPFHDGRGRFASSNGFASYSADPNKKAGAMAIARSVAAGHGTTVNVHGSSKGQTLTRNAQAMAQSRSGAALLRNTVEPSTGLKGASAQGAAWHATNQKNGTSIQQNAPKPKQPKQTQPKQQTPTQTQPKQQTPKQTQPKQTQPAQKPTKAKTTDHEIAEGQDLLKDPANRKAVMNMQTRDLMRQQGFDKPPKVVSDDEFNQLAKANGCVLARTVASPNPKTAQDRLTQFREGDFFFAEGDNNRLGNGLYFGMQKTGNLKGAVQDSTPYGNRDNHDVTFYATLDKSAKVYEYDDVKRMAKSEGIDVYGWDGLDINSGEIGSYAIAKGIDAIKDSRIGYVAVQNRSKLVTAESATFGYRGSSYVPSQFSGL